MSQKRMRVFAGPNGSGKTTILKRLSGEIPLGVYVNADDIERTLFACKILLFENYQLVIPENSLQNFFKESKFSPIKRNEPKLWKNLKVVDNILHVDCSIDSYLAADIADFIRYQLVANGISFTYETVMSHKSKIQFMKYAKRKGYRTYLYFVATEDPEININRVNIRVEQNGHAVSPDIIRKRYFKSLELLKPAIKLTNRAYIFDNSGAISPMIAEITDGIDVEVIDTKVVPNWFVNYLVNK